MQNPPEHHNGSPKTTHPSWGQSAPPYAELVSRFRPIFQRISAGALEREQKRELPYEAVNWLREAKFGALRVPKSLGGFGASLRQLFRLLVELGEADSNLPQIFRAHFAFVESRLNDEDQTKSLLWYQRVANGELIGAAMSERSETNDGSTLLTQEGGAWVLNGEKYYCTGALFADWIATAAIQGEQVVGVVVPSTAPGVTRLDDWDGFGQRLTASGTTKFAQVRVEEQNILRRFTAPTNQIQSYLTAFYQLVLLATLAGISKSVLRDAVAFVQPRKRAFGLSGNTVPRTHPVVQKVIGRISSLSFGAESTVDTVAQTLDEAFQLYLQDKATESIYLATEIQAFQAQQLVIDLVLESTTLLFEAGGASATSESLRLDRHWRNARTIASHNPAIYREKFLGDYFLNGTLYGPPRQKPPAESSESVEKTQ